MSAALDDVARVVCNSRGLTFGEKIGEGAFKKTYLVWTLEGEPWALKVVREECSVERTAREVDAMKKCSHPSIARLLDVSSVLCDGREYTFMLEEYMAGGTLAERIQDNLLSPDEAWAIGLQLIGAIEHIASRELVHRDLKPANIMFRRVWSDPVVVDFGLVRDLSAELGRAMRIASIVTRTKASSVYLVIVSNSEPRREFWDVEELKGALKLIDSLEKSGLPVLVGFSSSDMVLWKFAGAASCATGKFFNLRRFTSSRFEEPSVGGTPMAYWFEESLMAFLRESDVIRVRQAGGLSEASIKNPYGQEILECIDNARGQAWIGLGWRQWMYAFADLEKRIGHNAIDVGQLLRHADEAWLALDDANILTEERQNNGAWVRAWRRAIIEYPAMR